MGPIAGTCVAAASRATASPAARSSVRRSARSWSSAASSPPCSRSAGILVYIALRFRLSFAVGAVVATIHDLLITLAFLAIFKYELSLNVIAALLTITGYSMNDTIVIYDRVRENMRSMRRDNIASVVNAAVNQMLDRTMITGGLTLLSVIALFFFGGEVLKGFAFTMIVGIITGTYSSVFIAAAIVVIWQGRTPLKTAPAAPVAPARKTGKRDRRAS